ncbi:DUF1836 domain-containing protein [Paenibacillus thiaminolyticus]|uniref:DUF1836 domain-containing protein n=1 Tax=Paenibacillus thiaminolyticus TaxID=49283 RepID=UPI001163D5BB|nr:DUF1836 domain-containing protein [Paenibacillus thiaminolyticus]MDG0876288.1 DUF1836 domain-containing protein [Paenibacillus thiaminolyticus]NGP59010.1 DUF1836 domain-containing protein [Paenibacillus thiaminolyticus]WCR28823.1 DUF1836 domain-containing protein [Paenibacillus thiaminolyticus]
MESFKLTRKEMSSLLLSLQGMQRQSPLAILQVAWSNTHGNAEAAGDSMQSLLSLDMPHIIRKLIQGQTFAGFSLQEIADLGHLIEHSNISITSIQNWVKRDFKDLFASIKEGRKYSVNQAALLFMIDDLKCTLDFVSIRTLFDSLFRDRHGGIDPLQVYHAYAGMFEELDANNDQLFDVAGHAAAGGAQDALLEQLVKTTADRTAQGWALSGPCRKAVSNCLVIAVLSVQASYLQDIAKRYYTANVFLQFES